MDYTNNSDNNFIPNNSTTTTSMSDFFTSNQNGSMSNGIGLNGQPGLSYSAIQSGMNYERRLSNLASGSTPTNTGHNLSSMNGISPISSTTSNSNTNTNSVNLNSSITTGTRKSNRTIKKRGGNSIDDFTDSQEDLDLDIDELEQVEEDLNDNNQLNNRERDELEERFRSNEIFEGDFSVGNSNGMMLMMMENDLNNNNNNNNIGGSRLQPDQIQPIISSTPDVKPKTTTKKLKATPASTPTTSAAKGKGKAKGKKATAASTAAAAIAASGSTGNVNSYENGIEEDESEFEGVGKKVKGKQRKIVGDKKKKAGRACAACQKAHLTCDDARPCARCVKKNCADDCHDGARKKAKYLQEVPDELLERRPYHIQQQQLQQQQHQIALAQQQQQQQQALLEQQQALLPSPPANLTLENEMDSTDSPNGLDSMNDSTHLQQQQLQSQQQQQQQTFSFDTLPYYDTNSFQHEFGSEAANLEYAILSSMLNGNGFQIDSFGNESNNQDVRLNGSGNGSTMLGMNSPMDSSNVGGGPIASGSNGTGLLGSSSNTNAHNMNGLNSNGGYGSIFDRTTGSNATSPAGGLHFSGMSGLSPGMMIEPINSLSGGSNSNLDNLLPTTNPNSIISNNHNNHNNNNIESNSISGTIGSGSALGGGIGSSAGGGAYLLDPIANLPKKEYPGRTAQSTKTLTAEEVYRTVTKPYLYAESYHYLVRHLKERFEKNDILRIIRALATFRPSLIALQMPLTEEDETFVERTFQRTLVELNKLISFSGTPTVVWRRTGEICLVGTEFCLLTGWTREELLGKKYIFELFDTSSVVEYYESFAKHAFESTSPSVMTQCVVVGPSGRPVPCAFCFSVRRDLFSLPFIVIGSFLPVLS